MQGKPNIVFLFADDQRFDTIAALGNSEIKTPNIDRLVAAGTTFTRAHIPCGTSGAVCMPSRAMLNTGRSLFHLQDAGQTIPDEHTLLGETLQGAGYRTFGTGKWHNGESAYARSFTDGAEIFFGGMGDHWNVPACDFDPTGRYPGRPVCTDCGQKKDTFVRVADHIACGKHSSELFAGAAVDFIDSYDSDQPFYMYVSFMAPHDPRIMPARFRDMYDEDAITIPQNFVDEHPVYDGIKQIRDETLAPYPRTHAIVREHIADYYAMITHLDDEVGKVMAAVEAKGEFDNTVFIFSGDNGLGVGQHGLFGKQNLYDHSIRVPLIFAGPGIPAGKRTDSFAYLLDIYPTLCELIGADVPESVEGVSLLPAIRGDAMVRQDLYFAYTGMMRGVRDQQYKLIEYVDDQALHTELYDTNADPWETDNLAERSEFKAVVARLRLRLREYCDEWNDRGYVVRIRDRVDHMGEAFWSRYDRYSTAL